MTKHQRWKDERLCIISIVFNWHSTSVSSTEFNTELNTICTVRDSTIRLTNRPTLADLTVRLTTRLTTQSWQLDWRSDNSTGNSALQFSLQLGLTIPLTISSDEFALTNSTYNWPYNFGWPKWVKRSERPSSDSTMVQSRCLVSRPSLADVSRIGRSNGKGNPWQGQFLVALFGR